MGASDPMSRAPTLEERMEDIQVVMDAVGIDEAAVFGLSEGGSSAALFAATFPQRTRALVLCGAFPGGAAIAADSEPDFLADAMRNFWEKIVSP